MAAIAVVVLALPFAVERMGSESRTAAYAPAEALLVGDSVMNAMAQSYGLPARQLLAARHSFVLDTAGCRRLITTSCSIGSSPPPSNAITVVRARAGQYHRALVIGVGYNDPTTGTSGLSTAIDVMIAEARRQGVPYVVWLTYREAGPSAARFRAHNAMLRQKDLVHPELVIADWATRSAGLPTSWFSSDGIHLGADAAKSMADLIADVLDFLPPPTPPTTTTTTIPCQVTETSIAVTTAPPPSSVVAEIEVPADEPHAAQRLQAWCPPRG